MPLLSLELLPKFKLYFPNLCYENALRDSCGWMNLK